MQSNSIKRGIKGVGLGLFLALGIITFSSVEANAQWRDRNNRNDRYDRRDDRNRNDRWGRNNGGYGNNGMFNRARQQGYRDGMDVGTEQSRDGRRYDPGSSSRYRNATNGYESWMRDRDGYRNAYRQAFEQGYSEGFRRFGRGGNNRRGGIWGW